MDTTANQCTIAGPAAVEGFGYRGGWDVRVEFRPAEVNTGIVFVRGDLNGCPRIEARIENWVDRPRRTSLQCDGASVEMIEHIMAALAGLQIDNCEVWVDQSEMPGCDGSSQPFVEAIDAVGLVEQDAPRPQQIVRDVLRIGDHQSWFEARPLTSGPAVLQYHLEYGPESPIGRQTFQILLTRQSFRRELAPCRTFMLKSEADSVLAQGLGQRATYRDLLVFDARGPIDNQLRFPDECVRHKLLDMVGDLGLAGCALVGHFSAYRSGHRLNAELVKSLMGVTETVEPRRQCA